MRRPPAVASRGGTHDIELYDTNVGVVIEAKKGMSVPTAAQLVAYERRLHGADRRAIVSLSDLPADVAASALPASVSGTPVVHLTWLDIVRMAAEARPQSGLAARRVLDDLVTSPGGPHREPADLLKRDLGLRPQPAAVRPPRHPRR